MPRKMKFDENQPHLHPRFSLAEDELRRSPKKYSLVDKTEENPLLLREFSILTMLCHFCIKLCQVPKEKVTGSVINGFTIYISRNCAFVRHRNMRWVENLKLQLVTSLRDERRYLQRATEVVEMHWLREIDLSDELYA